MEGEGVDDYGGPYREVFSHVASELQQLSVASSSKSSTSTCALPLLLPSPNAAGGGGEERSLLGAGTKENGDRGDDGDGDEEIEHGYLKKRMK